MDEHQMKTEFFSTMLYKFLEFFRNTEGIKCNLVHLKLLPIEVHLFLSTNEVKKNLDETNIVTSTEGRY